MPHISSQTKCSFSLAQSARYVAEQGGVVQVGEAVTQMDQATQQNASLVEEMAAAANSLNVQGQELVQAVSIFRWNGVSNEA